MAIANRQSPIPSFPSWKQRLWHELHTFAAEPVFDPRSAAVWLARFTNRIPCRKCRSHWKRLLREHPPELQTRFTFFRWTVRIHNALNDHCGHPRLSWSDARERWAFDKTGRA